LLASQGWRLPPERIYFSQTNFLKKRLETRVGSERVPHWRYLQGPNPVVLLVRPLQPLEGAFRLPEADIHHCNPCRAPARLRVPLLEIGQKWAATSCWLSTCFSVKTSRLTRAPDDRSGLTRGRVRPPEPSPAMPPWARIE